MSQIALADALGTDALSLSGVLAELRDALGAVINVNGLWSVTYHVARLSADTLSANLPVAVFLDETTSTNDEAMNRPAPNFVFAEYQMAGRGRRNKRWFSLPGGGVLFSARLPMPLGVELMSGLPLAICVSLWRVLGANNLTIKWPNDLLDKSGRKVAGVLAIAKAKEAVIGVGINWLMNDTLRATIGRPASALTEIPDAPSSRAVVANTAATALWQGVKEFSQHGLAAFLDDAKKAHCIQAGEKILYSDGAIRRSAIFCGLGAGGELLLRNKNGEVQHTGGEINDVACG